MSDLEQRVISVEKKVENIEKNYGKKIALIEQSISDLKDGIQTVNKNLLEVKTIVARQDVVNEYMKDIYVTKEEFRQFSNDVESRMVSLETRLDTTENVTNSVWVKYGYIVATLAALANILMLFIRGGG